MFGLSFGELLVLLLVAVIVLGPKDLPRYMRKAGQFAARIRRLAFDMREKSGIDEVLRAEGIDRDFAEFRRLARGEIGSVMETVRSAGDPLRKIAAQPLLPAPAPVQAPVEATVHPVGPPLFEGNSEYPVEGADAYGALPDTARVYDGDFPPSPLSDDPLYTRGEESTATDVESAAVPALEVSS